MRADWFPPQFFQNLREEAPDLAGEDFERRLFVAANALTPWVPLNSVRRDMARAVFAALENDGSATTPGPALDHAGTQSGEPGGEAAHKPDQTSAVEGRGATDG